MQFNASQQSLGYKKRKNHQSNRVTICCYVNPRRTVGKYLKCSSPSHRFTLFRSLSLTEGMVQIPEHSRWPKTELTNIFKGEYPNCVQISKKYFRLPTKILKSKIRYMVSPFLQATKALRESRGIALTLLLDLGTRRGDGSASRPGRFLSPENSRYPLYRRLDGPQGLSGQVRKISPPSEFDPRTVQPVSSRYTN
jgi:hypothetical protein